MKKIQNPTNYFFSQAQNIGNPHQKQIDRFVQTLINKDNCQLCRHQYDTKQRIPRIMIHCGHTFCNSCLEGFFINRRVRCPMCLKLVKYLDSLDRLPINHTIYEHLKRKQNSFNQASNNNQISRESQKHLFREFQKSQKAAHKLQNPQNYDNKSGFPFCVFHDDRVQHFYCEEHETFGCRKCIETSHQRQFCKIIDLYEVDDLSRYKKMQMSVEEPDISDPFIPYDSKDNLLSNLNEDDKKGHQSSEQESQRQEDNENKSV